MPNYELEPQNWKLRFEVAKNLKQSKNLGMLYFRIKKNVSQEEAAKMAGLYTKFGNIDKNLWMGLENFSRIPTMDQAEKISELIGLPVWHLFPQLRVILDSKTFIRTTAKLTFVMLTRGLTKKKLAEMANVPIEFLTEIQRGFEANTDYTEYILRVCEALNSIPGFLKVEPEDIVGDIPDHFFVNYKSLQDLVESELNSQKEK